MRTHAARLASGLVLSLVTLGVTAAPPASAAPVTRLAGSGRVETAVAVAAASWDGASDVVLATAADFPDALASGALAASLGGRCC